MASRPRGIYKDNLSLYLAAFKACGEIKGHEACGAAKEILKTGLIFMVLLAI